MCSILQSSENIIDFWAGEGQGYLSVASMMRCSQEVNYLVEGDMSFGGTALAPTFIGNFRSGTTLLINILGLHEAITPWFETKALCEALRFLRITKHPECSCFEASLAQPPLGESFDIETVTARMLADIKATASRVKGDHPSGKNSDERYPIGNDCIMYPIEVAEHEINQWRKKIIRGKVGVDSIAEATGMLIQNLGALQVEYYGKPMWINKTPEIPRFGAELRQCMGGCRVIMLIRDGRDVIHSASRLGWGDKARIATWWKGMIEETRSAFVGHESDYLEIRYEDLIQDTAEQVNHILRFMGLPTIGVKLVKAYCEKLGVDAVSEKVSAKSAGLAPQGELGVIEGLDYDFMVKLGYQ